MNEEINTIMETFKNFTDGHRMIMLTLRGKEGGKVNNPDKVSRRKISANKEEFKKILEEFLKIKNSSPNIPLRIYSSVNARDINKGIREFKRRQLESDYYDEDSKYKFYLDIKNRFLSSIMVPASRAETKFLIDVDYDEGDNGWIIEQELLEAKVDILFTYKTKNGMHIVTEPFNPNLVSYKVNKDALLLLTY